MLQLRLESMREVHKQVLVDLLVIFKRFKWSWTVLSQNLWQNWFMRSCSVANGD